MRKFLLILLAMVTFEAAVAQDIKKEEACCSTEVKEEKVKKPRKPLINFEKVGKFFKYSKFYPKRGKCTSACCRMSYE